MNYANTSNIDINIAFRSKDIAISVLQKFVNAHKQKLIEHAYFDNNWKNETFSKNFFLKKKNVLQLEQKLVNFYENKIISSLRKNVIKEIKKVIQNWKGRRKDSDIDTATHRVLGDMEKNKPEGEWKPITEKCLRSKWWKEGEYSRRLDERTRISFASQIITDRTGLETSEYHGFNATTGQGEDNDENNEIEEEYCYICAKLVHDNVFQIVGTDFVACSSHCYNSYKTNRDNHKEFHQCSSCVRQIPNSIGKTCHTCQSKKKPRGGNNNGETRCCVCRSAKASAYKKRPNGKLYCWECWNKIPNCSQCLKENKKKKGWFKSSWGGNERFCSQTCLNRWQSANNKKRCAECGKEKKPEDFAGWDITFGKLFCSDDCTNKFFQKLRKSYIQKLKNLSGWGKLSHNEQEDFIDKINTEKPSEFDNIIKKAKSFIANKDSSGDNDNSLKSKIKKAIQEIEAELSKKPKVQFSGDGWKKHLENSSSIDQLRSIKNDLLTQIKNYRDQLLSEAKGLQNKAIKTIEEALSKHGIKSSELENPNWKEELETLVDKSEINNFRDKLLSEITQKKLDEKSKTELDRIIKEAQKVANNKDWKKLKDLLKRIGSFRNNRIYESRKEEISELEKKLSANDISSYKEAEKGAIESFFNEGKFVITTDELNPENRDYEEKINRASSPEEIIKIKKEVIEDGGNKKAEKKANDLIYRAEKATKNEDKSKIRQEIISFQNGNKWEKNVYKNKEEKFRKILSEWDKLDSTNNNFSFQKDWSNPSNLKSNLKKYLPKILIAFSLVIFALLVIKWIFSDKE